MSDFDLARYQDPLAIQRVLNTASTIAVRQPPTRGSLRRPPLRRCGRILAYI